MKLESIYPVIALLLAAPLTATATDYSLQQRVEMLEARLDASNSNATAHTHLGSYGELHLNRLRNRNGSDKDELDAHRFVLSISHEFSEQTRLFSELEIEHGSSGSSGLVVLEQAYIEHTLNETLHLKAGIMVMPVGIVSETHEPPTFYGVERNQVETNIIPTTWSEGGISLTGRLQNGLSLEAAITSGLAANATTHYAVRDGRQDVSKAQAQDAAYTARVKWSGWPGLEWAATLHHQSDITQHNDMSAGAATLYETHIVMTHGAFGLRTLYARWQLDGNGPAAAGASNQNGWYAEPAWRFSERWGIFTRYSSWDNRASDQTDSRISQVDLGLNFWPHPDLVVKLDYQNQHAPAGSDEYDGINLGLGYLF